MKLAQHARDPIKYHQHLPTFKTVKTSLMEPSSDEAEESYGLGRFEQLVLN